MIHKYLDIFRPSSVHLSFSDDLSLFSRQCFSYFPPDLTNVLFVFCLYLHCINLAIWPNLVQQYVFIQNGLFINVELVTNIVHDKTRTRKYINFDTWRMLPGSVPRRQKSGLPTLCMVGPGYHQILQKSHSIG